MTGAPFSHRLTGRLSMLFDDTPAQDPQRRSVAARMVAVLARVVALAAFVALLALTLPSLAGWQRFVVDDDAMAPTLDRGAVVWDEAVPIDRLAPGDIVTFHDPESGVAVTRRISRTGRDPHARPILRVQGDANPDPDAASVVLDRPVLTRVKLVIPGLGWLLLAIADPWVRMLATLLPAIGLMGWLVVGLAREAGRLDGTPVAPPRSRR
jgi:signal peptidase I